MLCFFKIQQNNMALTHSPERKLKQEVNKNNRQISQIYISTVITYNQRNSIETSLGLLLQVYTKIFVLNAKKKKMKQST